MCMREIMKPFFIVAALLLVLLALVIPETVTACPNCKEAYAADGSTPVSSGFSASIMFLMSMPFFVIGMFALRLWVAQRKLRREAMAIPRQS